MRRSAVLLLALALCAAPASAQRARVTTYDTAGAFADNGARILMNRARATRLASDSSLRSYTALVKTRMAIGLRMPLKDRTLGRQETAARVRWSRDAQTVIQMRAGRAQNPDGVEIPDNLGIQIFEPAGDRMFFGMISSSRSSRRDTAQVPRDSTAAADTAQQTGFFIYHPLGIYAEQHYRFESGDTLTIRLQDGTELRAIELRATPKRDDVRTVRGLLWIDPATGALVQAAFRLARTIDMTVARYGSNVQMGPPESMPDTARDISGKIPGFLKPIEFDISLFTVEYSLWEQKHWLPRTMRTEGVFRIGMLQTPGAFETSYNVEEVETDADGRRANESETARLTAEQWAAEGDYRRLTRRQNNRDYVTLMPRDSTELLRSAELPPPIWKDAPGFATEDDLEEMADRLGKLPVPFRRNLPVRFGWGLGEPDMVRYNRVEALSLGARATVPLPFAIFTAVGRIGLGDLHPNAELMLQRPSVRRTLALRAYHELATVDASRRELGLGNSLSSLLFGRDEGEYYRATGAAFTWSPPTLARQSWDFTTYVEDQNDVQRHTHVAVPRIWNDSVFRANIVADEALQYGALLRLRPWWGTDPLRSQFGMDVLLQAEAGDYEHARGRVTLRAAAPLFAGARMAVEAAVGTSTGTVPVQRLFYLGGASTLRGYEPSTVSGTSMARARLELARTTPAFNFAVFSDWGWAGDRTDIARANERLSVGIGASLLDGFIRVDLGRGLRGPRSWRLDLYLDAIM